MTTADTMATIPVMRHAHTGVIVAHGRDVFTKVANATLSSDVHASPAAPSRDWVSKSISINGDAGDGGCDGGGGGGGAGGGDGGGGDGPSTTFVAITGGTTSAARRKPAPR